MSMPPPHEPYMSPEGMPPPRQGMSTGAKLLVILGVLFLLLLLVCCGGIAATFFWFRGAISQDPAVIRQASDEIARIDLPEAFTPAMSMDMKVPFVGQRIMTLVIYSDQAGGSMVMLAGASKEMGRENMEMQMDQQMRQQGMRQRRKIVNQRTETKEFVVLGQNTTFNFVYGKDAENGKPRLEVTGTFEGQIGPSFFLFSGDEEKYDAEAVTKMIQSIH